MKRLVVFSFPPASRQGGKILAGHRSFVSEAVAKPAVSDFYSGSTIHGYSWGWDYEEINRKIYMNKKKKLPSGCEKTEKIIDDTSQIKHEKP